MSYLEHLFNLDSAEREALATIIKLIESLVAEDSQATAGLAARLKPLRSHVALQHYDSQVVNTLMDAITETLEDRNSVSFLINRLYDHHDRVLAATMLGWFGPVAQVAIPELIGLASGSGTGVGAAKKAVILIGHAESEILSVLKRSICTNDDGEFRGLCDLFIRAGYTLSADFIDVLRVAAKSASPHIREAVVDVILQLDSVAKQQLVDVLNQLKNDPDDHVREAAIEASQ